MEALVLLLLSALLAGTTALPRQAGEAAPLDDWPQLKGVGGHLIGKVTSESRRFRDHNTRIIHGQEATKGQFPYMAAIVLSQQSFCCGSILSTSWILTAAHCVEGYSRWDVTVGVTDRSEDNGVTMTSSEAHYNPEYNKQTLAKDVGVIKLPNELTYSELIKPTKMPTRASKTENLVKKEGRISGWGRTLYNSPLQTKLRWATLYVISNAECARKLGVARIRDSDFLICANNPKKDSRACSGDSGSPFVLVEDGVQVGIHSFSGSKCSRASGMSRTAYFLDWISNTTGVELP